MYKKYEHLTGTLYNGDCKDVIKDIPSKSIDLIVTSPPYADMKDRIRNKEYKGIDRLDFVEWFTELSIDLSRVLKDTGSFILNIDTFYNDDKTRNVYIYELVLEIVKKTNLKFIQDLFWFKNNPVPSGYASKWIRFRTSAEYLFWFANNPDNIKMDLKKVGTKISNNELMHLKSRGKKNKINIATSGHRMNYKHIYETVKNNGGITTPINVIYGYTASSDKYTYELADKLKYKHPAKFPFYLPEFFIEAFTDKGDTVLDPFFGSGTVAEVCKMKERKWIGIEISEEYFNKYVEYASKQTNDLMSFTEKEVDGYGKNKGE